MTAIILISILLTVLIVAKPQPARRHSAPRRPQLHLAEAPDAERFEHRG